MIPWACKAQKLPERAVKTGEARVWHILKKHRYDGRYDWEIHVDRYCRYIDFDTLKQCEI